MSDVHIMLAIAILFWVVGIYAVTLRWSRHLPGR